MLSLQKQNNVTIFILAFRMAKKITTGVEMLAVNQYLKRRIMFTYFRIICLFTKYKRFQYCKNTFKITLYCRNQIFLPVVAKI